MWRNAALYVQDYFGRSRHTGQQCVRRTRFLGLGGEKNEWGDITELNSISDHFSSLKRTKINVQKKICSLAAGFHPRPLFLCPVFLCIIVGNPIYTTACRLCSFSATAAMSSAKM